MREQVAQARDHGAAPLLSRPALTRPSLVLALLPSRWAGRGATGYQQLAEDGFAVLGERLRSAEERGVVGEVLHKVLRAQLDMPAAYQRRGDAPLQQLHAALEQEAMTAAAAEQAAMAGVEPASGPLLTHQQAGEQQRHAHSVADVAALRSALGGVVWTASMRRM